ncbi:MAG: hypothetical protein OXC68_02405 [Aestuariivita sp.]|nr:hypothetical protein [Aestuariivita sp.]
MTTVVSRLYADEGSANSVCESLKKADFPDHMVSVITEANASAIAETRVTRNDAVTYAEKMQTGNVLVVVRAPVNPFGAARAAMSIMDDVSSLHVGAQYPNLHIREAVNSSLFLSILSDHPRFFSMDIGPDKGRTRGLASDGLSWKLLTEHRSRRSGSSGWFTSTKILPFPLLAKKSARRSAIAGGRRFLYNPSKFA